MKDYKNTFRVSSRFDSLAQRFASDTRGQFAVVFALMVMGLIAGAAASVDLAGMNSSKDKIQNLMDSSVLAGITASADEEEQKRKAKEFFALGYQNIIKDELLGYEAQYNIDGDYLVGNVTTKYKTIFAWPLGSRSFPVKVASTATEGSRTRGPVCIMAMHPTRAHTLEMKDSVSLNAPDCHIYGNSSNVEDVVDLHSPDNYMTGKSVQAIGFGHHYINNVTPPLAHAPELIPDPFLTMQIPKVGSACKADRLRIPSRAKKTKKGVSPRRRPVTLEPGTYCGGLEIGNGAHVKLKRGTYIFTGGDLSVTDATLEGRGVTIVLKDKAAIIWENAKIKLQAPKTGKYASFAIMGDRLNVDHEMTESKIDIHGVVYLPVGEFTWSNTGTPRISALWTVWIVDGFTWDGDGVVNIPFKPELSEIPFPGKLKNIIPTTDKTARLVR